MTRPRDIADGINRIDTSAADATAITIDANENVGIGTSSPSKQLHQIRTGSASDLPALSIETGFITQSTNVAASSQNISIVSGNTGEGRLFFGDTDDEDIGNIVYNHTSNFMSFDTAGTERMRIDSSGNVGIGTTSPSTSLDVVRAGVQPLRVQSTSGTEVAINMVNTGGNVQLEAHSGNFTIDADNVGIGTTSPVRQFHIHESSGGSNAYIHVTGAATGTTTTDGLSILVTGSTGQAIINQREAQPLAFYTSNTERIRIRDDGNVGIGTSGAATVRLFVVTADTGNYNLYVQNTSGSFNGENVVSQSQRVANSAYSLMTMYASTDREFNFRGDGNAFADGSFSGGGADYAEMFEWDDGNSSNEDRRGYSVVLTNGNKIRKATSSDTTSDIIGIVSANPTVLGDSAWNMWDEKYNKDDFGNYILETYTVTEWTEPAVTNDDGEVTQEAVEHSYETDKIPSDLTVPSNAVVSSVDADDNALERRQLNPSYDDTQTYTPREQRQEWDAVGMMGKLRIRAGQPTGDRWIKMRDIATDDNGNVTVEEWLIR